MGKTTIKVGPVRTEYSGDQPFIEPLKVGLVLILTTTSLLCVWKGVDYYYWKKKKKFQSDSSKEDSKTHQSASTRSSESSTMASPDVQDLVGHSSSDLFQRTSCDSLQWIVDGYMKKGLVNFLVGGGGVGKSLVMTQIALAADKGSRPEFLPKYSHNAAHCKVIYYRLEDFPNELSGKYGEGQVLCGSAITWYLLSDLSEQNLEGFLVHLQTLAEQLSEDTLVCIDPATKLDGYRHDQFISGLEKALQTAQTRGHTLSFIASVHHDEIKEWAPLTSCDVKGGDDGFQHAGSVTAIRKARYGHDCLYIQALKAPKGEPMPNEGSVIVMRKVVQEIDKHNKYVHYQFDSIKPETQARPLKPKAKGEEESTVSLKDKHAPNQKITPEKEKKISEMLEKGMTIKQIAREMRVSNRTIGRYKKKMVSALK